MPNILTPRLLFRISQIWLKKEDEEKTSFTTPFDTYCYTRKPKGLKNTGATFARMTKKGSRSSAAEEHHYMCR
jgi:hypothetical protein